MEIPADVAKRRGRRGDGVLQLRNRGIQYPHSPCRALRSSPFPLTHANRLPSPSVPLIDIEGRAARRRTAIILKSIKCHRGFLSRSNVRSAQAPRHPNLRRVRRRIIDEAATLAIGRREIADNSVNPQVRSYTIRHFTLKM